MVFFSLYMQTKAMFELQKQNLQLTQSSRSPTYQQELAQIEELRRRENAKYIGEGLTFFVLISIGAALDIASLSDKQACLEIHKQLAALAKEYPGMKAEENGELSAIGRECQLMVYSSIEAPGKKEELKERTLQLARKLEQDHSAYL